MSRQLVLLLNLKNLGPIIRLLESLNKVEILLISSRTENVMFRKIENV